MTISCDSQAEALRERLWQTEQSVFFTEEEWLMLLQAAEQNQSFALSLRSSAKQLRDKIFGRAVYLRGLIEVSNICARDCLYCGIRRSNKKVKRYRLTKEEILDCCRQGHQLGLRTFVMQGGEDGHLSDSFFIEIIKDIKAAYPDTAVTLSLGERPKSSYQKFWAAGADRYLLRHETASAEHFAKLKSAESVFAERMRCLTDLKEIGFQTGCGFMVGSPYQTLRCLAKDLFFIQNFRPHMVGLGPFIPHCDTPFANYPTGSLETTLNCLALVRLMLPQVLLPSTTALASISEQGRILGLESGGNVVMPNLSPLQHRSEYTLYNHKAYLNTEAAEGIGKLDAQLQKFGYYIDYSRGDAAQTN
ncbi:MAG: [FeFe] hydrogenase H-cluster radical SAM maturase HydE [Candidatus Bruticola sp.]